MIVDFLVFRIVEMNFFCSLEIIYFMGRVDFFFCNCFYVVVLKEINIKLGRRIIFIIKRGYDYIEVRVY